MTDLPDAIEAAKDVLAGRGNGTYDEALDAIRWLLAALKEDERHLLAYRFPIAASFPLGTPVRKVSGPEWQGVVVGYYSSTLTPEGLVIECTAPGARGQVHVEPAKRMKRIGNQEAPMD